MALLTIAPMWLLGRTTLPPNNIKELIAWLTVNGDRATVILGERATSTSLPSDTSWLCEPTTGVHSFGGGSLRRLRNGDSQLVRVEHVHVNEGGQAMIGNVNPFLDRIDRRKVEAFRRLRTDGGQTNDNQIISIFAFGFGWWCQTLCSGRLTAVLSLNDAACVQVRARSMSVFFASSVLD